MLLCIFYRITSIIHDLKVARGCCTVLPFSTNFMCFTAEFNSCLRIKKLDFKNVKKNFFIYFCLKFCFLANFSELQNHFFDRLTWAEWRKHHGMCTSEIFVRLKTCKCIIIQVLIDSESHTTYILLTYMLHHVHTKHI